LGGAPGVTDRHMRDESQADHGGILTGLAMCWDFRPYGPDEGKP
jgi:hypothetical protein